MNDSDAAAQRHDLAYNKYLKQGKNPYLNFNKADQQFIRETKGAKDWGGKLGHLIFKGKRALFPKLSEPDLAPPAKKPRQKPPAHIFVNLARKRAAGQLSGGPGGKRGNMEQGEFEGAGDGPPEAQSEQPEPAAAGGGGGGGGAGGGGGKGGGVGHSTGQYDNRTLWKYLGNGEVEITCYATRMIHQNMPDEEQYRTVQYKTRGNGFGLSGYGHRDDAHVQVTTPWKLVDCNAWGVWFCPADWQHLVNTCDELRLIDFEQQIFNLVIKTVTEIGPADARVKQYANDLTASMMIAQDSNNIFPYTPAAMRSSTLGFYPWRACTLPDYSYYGDWTATVRPTSINANRQIKPIPSDSLTTMYSREGADRPTKVIRETYEYETGPDSKRRKVTKVSEQTFSENIQSMQFYCIESQIPITMIRTGDGWSSGKYTFNCKAMDLTHNWQTTRQIGMPPKQISLPTASGSDLQMPSTANRVGRYWGQQTNNNWNIWEATMVRPTTLGYQFPEWVFMDTGGGPAIVNGPLGSRQSANEPYWTNGAHSYRYQRSLGSNQQFDNYTTSGSGAGATAWSKRNTWIQKNNNGHAANGSELLGTELVENNTHSGDSRVEMGKWLPHTLNTYSPYTSFKIPSYDYPWGQVWDKRPDCEIKAAVQPTAPFLVDNPPGQILTKLAPNLTETYNQESGQYSRIVTYADYWWKGKLTFRAKLRVPSQWNLIQFINFPPGQNEGDLKKYVPSDQGNIQMPYMPSQVVPKKVY